MSSLLSLLSVKATIRLGFGVILSIIALMIVSSLSRVDDISLQVDNLLSVNLNNSKLQHLKCNLISVNSILMTYLLDKDPANLERFKQARNGIEQNLSQLQQIETINHHPAFNHIQQLVTQLLTIYTRLIPLATDNDANYPGQKFVVEQINPDFDQVRALISTVLDTSRELADELSEDLEGEEKVTRYLDQMQIIATAQEMRYVWVNVGSTVRGYLAFRNDNLFASLTMFRNAMIQGADSLLAQADKLDPDQVENIRTISTTLKPLFEKIEKLRSIHGGEAWRTDAAVIKGELNPLLNQLSNEIDSLINDSNQQQQQSSDLVTHSLTTMSRLMVILAIVSVLVTLSSGYLTTQSLSLLVQSVRHAVHQLMNGNLTYRMVNTQRGEATEIGEYFNQMTTNLQSTIGEFTQVIDHINRSAAEAVAIAESCTTATSNQKMRLSNAAEEVQEFNGVFDDISRTSNSADTMTRTALNSAKEGSILAHDARQTMNHLALEVQSVAEIMDGVKKGSGAISNVLEVIRSISQQTNLLALNAAIEAARAGEHGRGFAVVADEVRTLATRTQESTGEIQGMIEHLQKETAGAVSAIEKAVEQAIESASVVAKVSESLTTISTMTDQISQMNSSINSSINAQSHRVDHLAEQIQSINTMADQTVEGANRTHDAGHQLSELAHQLESKVHHFQV